MPFEKKHLSELAKVALQNQASDIHIRELEAPCFRIRGSLTPIKSREFSHTDMVDLCSVLLDGHENAPDIQTLTECDGSYDVTDVCRLRFNILRFQKKYAVVLRIIKQSIPTFTELNLPSSLEKIALHSRGMILVTGTTGSGKSATMAALINHINQNRRTHVLTLEDPVEFLHPQIKSRITQREIGTDTPGFIEALRSALRQDPDVISIGEMRDSETASIALKAAETGHLVLSTVHTTDALSTVGRLIAMFPPEEQDNARKRIAENLYATISQRLLKTADGKGRVPAVEIMIMDPGIRDCILGKDELRNMYTYIEQGFGQTGTQSFDQHVGQLLRKGLINQETAAEAASSEDFFKKLEFTK